jgi:hypothetical protein
MKNTFKIITIIVLAVLTSCKNTSSEAKDNFQVKSSSEKQVEQNEKTQFTDEELDSIHISLIGKVPRMQLDEYMDSLRGVETNYDFPDSWKLGREIAMGLLDEWNEEHNNHDAGAVINHYMDGAVLNGKLYEHQEAIKIKEDLFKRYPNLKQRILLKSIRYNEKSPTEARIDFQKVVTVDGKDKTYDSFLRIGSFNGDFMLIEEGDVK